MSAAMGRFMGVDPANAAGQRRIRRAGMGTRMCGTVRWGSWIRMDKTTNGCRSGCESVSAPELFGYALGLLQANYTFDGTLERGSIVDRDGRWFQNYQHFRNTDSQRINAVKEG